MRIFKIFIIATIVLLITPFLVRADFDAYEYWIRSGTKRTVTWEPVPGAEGYEVYIYVEETSTKLLTGRILTTNSHEITWKTKGRHYTYYVRSFMTVDGNRVFSEWTNSLDGTLSLVGERPRAWVIYVP